MTGGRRDDRDGDARRDAGDPCLRARRLIRDLPRHDAARVIELAHGGVDPRALLPRVAAAEAGGFFVSETRVACIDDDVVAFVSWRGAFVTWPYVAPGAQRRRVVRLALPGGPDAGPDGRTRRIDRRHARPHPRRPTAAAAP